MNTKGNRFKNSQLRASIVALVASDSSTIEVTPEVIRGTWGKLRHMEEREIRNAIESLLNSRLTAEELRIFVEKYGPLESTCRKSGDPFEETVRAWSFKQRWLRELWVQRMESRGWSQVSGKEVIITISPGEALLRFNALSPAMEACLNAVPANHLGTCRNPECASPYFLKQRPTETYCGNLECSAYGQRLAKRTWWSKHGKNSKPAVTKAPSKGPKKKSRKP